MAFRSRRHFPLFFVVSFPYMIDYLFYGSEGRYNKFSFLKNRYLNFFLGAVFLTISTYVAISTNFTRDPFSNRKFCEKYPCGAFEFLDQNDNLKDKRIFNHYTWGGWFIWRMPGKQMFIDGRIPQYRYKNWSFLEEYFAFFDESLAEKKLAEHGIEMVIGQTYRPYKVSWVEKRIFGLSEEKLNRRSNHLGDFLENSPLWEKVYEDKISYIFIKK
jgi:hypothetical protein